MDRCIIKPLQKDKGRLRFEIDGLKIELWPHGLTFKIGDDYRLIPTEVFELFLAQRTRADLGLKDPCPICGKGEYIFVGEDGAAVHHVWDGQHYSPQPCLNFPK